MATTATIAKKRIEFEFFAPQAKEVQLAGDFNGWNPNKTPLKKDWEGKWRTSLSFPNGRYEYRFLVDGEWQNEQRQCECVSNSFGTSNCVLQVR
ncbi:MAG: hypothetical protein A3G87_00635 [Omnitrophica bacterium RIFCSPLOWO2_12_FULL_50_11]|nr:MAG: hypothetical protein A3G87_00635 [Omnitrophica bacterium RIFCSPLOWO2_12_FULL_50_11]